MSKPVKYPLGKTKIQTMVTQSKTSLKSLKGSMFKDLSYGSTQQIGSISNIDKAWLVSKKGFKPLEIKSSSALYAKTLPNKKTMW